MKISSGFWVLGVAVLATGCASVTATGRNASGYPIPYAGTRLNLTAIRGDEVRLAMYRDNGIEAPAHPGWDLPLSLVADTVMLPVDALYPATTWGSFARKSPSLPSSEREPAAAGPSPLSTLAISRAAKSGPRCWPISCGLWPPSRRVPEPVGDGDDACGAPAALRAARSLPPDRPGAGRGNRPR